MKRIVYHPGAQKDVLGVVEYYEREAGLQTANRFITELRHFIENVAERPESYSKLSSDIRRAHLQRFPYHILFRILDDKVIKVISIKHDRRDPVYARRRR
jgi:plasmid stabilization system protein ParE